MMKYTLPFPDVSRRVRIAPWQIYDGGVYAFRMKNRTGIIIMETPSWFLAAVNLYEEEGRIWMTDELPEGIELYEASEEEKKWGLEYYLDYYGYGKPCPILYFVEHKSPNEYYSDVPHVWNFCFDMIENYPFFESTQLYVSFVELTGKVEEILKEDTGLQFNPYRTELYCYLMAVLNIFTHADDEVTCNYNIRLLRKNWYHFSWMFGMVIGRVIGSKLQNFTSVVNVLGNSKDREKYLHLYLPLVEANVDKICHYSAIEKRDKLTKAIEKMKLNEQRTEQETDLDKLYEIVFTSSFVKTMNESRPAAEIAELKQSINSLRKLIDEQNVELSNLRPLKKMADDMTNGLNNNSISFDALGKAIVETDDPEKAKQIFWCLDWNLEDDKTWVSRRHEIIAKIKERIGKASQVAQTIVQGDLVMKQNVKNQVNGVATNAVGIITRGK